MSQARERPRDHQPFLPVALMFEKRPDLYNTTHGPPVALPVIRGLVWGRSLLHGTACRNHTHKPLLAELRPSFQTLPPLPRSSILCLESVCLHPIRLTTVHCALNYELRLRVNSLLSGLFLGSLFPLPHVARGSL